MYRSLIVLLFLLLVSGCSQYTKNGEARLWLVPDSEAGFPEQQNLIKRSEKGTFGVAFSGGGTRSAAATYGQLRMLNNWGWLDKIDYISSVSGGTWGSLPYIYLPTSYLEKRAKRICQELYYEHKQLRYISRIRYENCENNELKLLQKYFVQQCEIKSNMPCESPKSWADFPEKFIDKLYLGEFIPPENITKNEILRGIPVELDDKKEPQRNTVKDLAILMFDYSASAIMADNSHILDDYLGLLIQSGDETYSEILGQVFLNDIDLFELKKRDKRYFSHISTKREDRGATDKRNSDDFYFTRAGRPFHIANMSMMQGGTSYKDYIYYQMTPLYVGPLGRHTLIDKKTKKRRELSYLIDSWAFDAKKPSGKQRKGVRALYSNH